METGFDITGAIFLLGIIFWLAGGASWVSEKTRQLKVENDRKELENKAKARDLGISPPVGE